MTDDTQSLSTDAEQPAAGTTTPVVTGTGGRPGIVADATNTHGTAPVQIRNARFASTAVNDFPVITGREAAWKYTPIAALSDLDDGPLGPFDAEVDVAIEPAGRAVVRRVGRDDPRIGLAGIPEDRVAANAWSSFAEATAIELRGEEPVSVTVTRTGRPGPGAAHTVIDVAPFARGTVVLDNRGGGHLAENVEILVGDSADVTVVSVQDWDDDAVHVANHFVQVGRDARAKHVVVSLGGAVVRVNPSATLGGSGADGELLGVSFADAGQHLESQVFLFHKGEHTRGRVEYRSALQGESAHSVWIGDVLIGPDAVGTDSYEQNRNLVLTDGARADSVPNLEIETGDIAGAGHASATGRFDDEQLFYLQARGIPEDAARRLVVRGFLAAIVQKIGVPDLEERLHAAIEDELAGTPRLRGGSGA